MKCPLTTRSGQRRLLAGELRAHVLECAECSAWMRSQRAVWDLLDVWEPAAPSAFFDSKLRSRLESAPPHAWWRRAFSLPVAAGAMIAAALLLNAPSPRSTAKPPHVATLDLQQMDQTFEDLQLLNQLDPSQDEQ
jgi:hypothetical protein